MGCAVIKRLQRQRFATVFAAVRVHCNIARGLMQVGARLRNLAGSGLKHPHEGVVRQVFGLLTVSQATCPGADQLFVVLEKPVLRGG